MQIYTWGSRLCSNQDIWYSWLCETLLQMWSPRPCDLSRYDLIAEIFSKRMVASQLRRKPQTLKWRERERERESHQERRVLELQKVCLERLMGDSSSCSTPFDLRFDGFFNFRGRKAFFFGGVRKCGSVKRDERFWKFSTVVEGVSSLTAFYLNFLISGMAPTVMRSSF